MLEDPGDLDQRIADTEAHIASRFAAFRADGKRLFATSSFQSNSVVLLSLLSRFAPEVPVYFLDTGYHFPETLAFRDTLALRLGLRVETVRSPVPRDLQRDPRGRLLYSTDPDHCCHLNKVLPLEPVIHTHDVWVAGVRGGQSATRAQMGEDGTGRHGIARFHPILRWDARMVHAYVTAHDLPSHPLEPQGYLSVGCHPCTRSLWDGGYAATGERGGRWGGMKKTECGLHMGVTAAPPAGSSTPSGGTQ